MFLSFLGLLFLRYYIPFKGAPNRLTLAISIHPSLSEKTTLAGWWSRWLWLKIGYPSIGWSSCPIFSNIFDCHLEAYRVSRHAPHVVGLVVTGYIRHIFQYTPSKSTKIHCCKLFLIHQQQLSTTLASKLSKLSSISRFHHRNLGDPTQTLWLFSHL